MEFNDLKYNSFDDLEYDYMDEPCTVWQASQIDILMTKPTVISDFEYRIIKSQLQDTLTYGEALDIIEKLKSGLR